MRVVERAWAPEIVVDTALATMLIDDQFPRLRPVVAEPLHAGWDNTVFRVNDDFVFRFPRRQIAAPLIETEVKCLGLIAPLLPAPVPRPVFTGRASPAYPWPFAGYGYIPGFPAAGRVHADRAREAVAAASAVFLKALHGIPLASIPSGSIPVDELDRMNARKRRPITESRLRDLASAGLIADPAPFLAIIDTSPHPSAPSRLVVTHGDLHPGQLLVDEQNTLTGVIDWGDIHLGDPAVDLAAVHQLLPRRLHHRFLSAYGPVDELSWQLARARATWHAVALLASAYDAGDDGLVRCAIAALAFVL